MIYEKAYFKTAVATCSQSPEPKPSTKKWNGSAWSNYGYSDKDAEGMFLVVKKPIIDWYDEWKRSSVPKSRAIQEYMAFYLDHWR